MMKLKSANLHYGTRHHPIAIPARFNSLPTGTLDDATLTDLCEVIAHQTGNTLSPETVKARITHHLVVDYSDKTEMVEALRAHNLPIPETTTQVLGNGFSIVWNH
jgi:hypothetical protein